MSMLSQAIRHPIPHDAAQGLEARGLFAGLPAAALDLIEGTAGCSPYLAGLMRREADWLAAGSDTALDALVQTELDSLTPQDGAQLSSRLRQAKRRVALAVALADLGGLWDLDQVTGALTRLADGAVQAALSHFLAAEAARGKLPGLGRDAPPDCAGMVVLAMGKMGAFELNYSSDIDLIVLFDGARHHPDHFDDLRAGLIRVTRRMVQTLSEATAEGYVFRTDLRLRPDASVTPVCISMEAAERYYESFGRTWERAAYIKARPAAGSISAGTAFLRDLTPFVWRKYLDFAAIEEAHDMRLRIREHKGLHGPLQVPGHDLKLGRGGIREIEFFAQTRQLICGGRDPGLRQPRTLDALSALEARGWVEAGAVARLSSAYVAHRGLEHRLQMLDDAQTHRIPEDPARRDRLAAFCGASDRDGFERDIRDRLAEVDDLAEAFFVRETGRKPAEAPPPGTFARPELVDELFEKWARYPALRTQRARTIFRRIRPDLLARAARAASPDEALLQFDAFLAGLPAGVQVFSLFEANPELLDLLLDICASAPQLARYLGRNAKVLDAVLGRDFFQPMPDLAAHVAHLRPMLDAAPDYESVLDTVRRWAQEQRFRIGVHLLRGISGPDEAAGAYSDLAEACLVCLLPHAAQQVAGRHGVLPGRGAVVIAMGKLGSREMTPQSDLDLIIVYDAPADAMSDGRRALAPSGWFARLTQALVSALTVATSEGALYEVDMRLRPSGRQGPVATSLAAFAAYQQSEAWTWEHLAMVRARVVAGDAGLAADVTAAMHQALRTPHDRARVLADIADMRRRLSEARPGGGDDPFEVKHGPGRLMELDMLVQGGALLHGLVGVQGARALIPALQGAGWLDTAEADMAQKARRLYAAMQQASRLAVATTFSPQSAGQGVCDLICASAGVQDIDALGAQLREASSAVAQMLDTRLQTGGMDEQG